MNKRVIFNGRLDFKNNRSYERVIDLYEQRALTFYKDDVVLKIEELTEDDNTSLTIPKHVSLGSEKSWKNTVQLLQYISQYAISGKVEAWMTDNGQILLRSDIIPQGDKSAIANYNKGCELLKEEGKESEAIAAFEKAIDKYADHAFAFEKKGYLKYIMKNYDEALLDFNTSIELYSENPNSLLGRSKVYIAQGDYVNALADLENVLKFSVPYQSSFWSARRLKAKAHLAIEEWDKAEFELRFFTKKSFDESDPNHSWRRASLVEYAKLMIRSNEFEKAETNLERARKHQSKTGVSEKDIDKLVKVASEEQKLPDWANNVLL